MEEKAWRLGARQNCKLRSGPVRLGRDQKGDDKAKEIEAKRMRRDYMKEERAKETEESQKVSQENWVRL